MNLSSTKRTWLLSIAGLLVMAIAGAATIARLPAEEPAWRYYRGIDLFTTGALPGINFVSLSGEEVDDWVYDDGYGCVLVVVESDRICTPTRRFPEVCESPKVGLVGGIEKLLDRLVSRGVLLGCALVSVDDDVPLQDFISVLDTLIGNGVNGVAIVGDQAVDHLMGSLPSPIEQLVEMEQR